MSSGSEGSSENKIYGEGAAPQILPPGSSGRKVGIAPQSSLPINVAKTAEQLDSLPGLRLTDLQEGDRIVLSFAAGQEETPKNMVILVNERGRFDPFIPQAANASAPEVTIVAGQNADKTTRLRLNGGSIGSSLSTDKITPGMPWEMQTLPPPDSDLPGILTTETITTPPVEKIALIREGKKYPVDRLPPAELPESKSVDFRQMANLIERWEKETDNPYLLKAEDNEVWLYDSRQKQVVVLKKINDKTINISIYADMDIPDLDQRHEVVRERMLTAYNISQNPQIEGIMGARFPREELQKAGLPLAAGVEIWVNQGEIKVRDNIHLQGNRGQARKIIKSIRARQEPNGRLIVNLGKKEISIPPRAEVIGQIKRLEEKMADWNKKTTVEAK